MAGPMMIDLGKRAGKRALHAAESALSWQGWNSANPLHPKGPDGRWVKGHPFTRIIGDAPDHIHHLSDEDLASVDMSAKSLLSAITAERGRRGIGHGAADIPASRTYGTRPKEDFSVAGGSEEALATAYSRTRGLRERLANARTREEGHALLSDLEKKDLLQVAREMNIPGASALSKDNLRREVVEGSVGRRLDMIATRGFEGPLPGTGKARRINELTGKIREAEADLAVAPVGSQARARALKKLKDLKDERGRLGSAAMGTPGREKTISEALFGPEPLLGSKARPSMDVPNPAKPLRAARKPKTDIESVRANWEAAVNGPMPSDRERFRTELSGLTIKQLEELNGEKLPAGAKAQKINHMIEHRLGFRLNSETIRSTPLSRAETPEQIRIRQEMHAADLAGDRETYRRLHLERLNLRDEEPPATTSRPSTSAGDIETQRAHVAELRDELAGMYGDDPDRWPEARSDRQVEAYWDARDRLSKMEQKRDEGLSRRFQLETRRDELQASLRARGIGPSDAEIGRLSDIATRVSGVGGGNEASLLAELSRENLSIRELKDMAEYVGGSKAPPAARSKGALQRYLAQTLAGYHRRTGRREELDRIWDELEAMQGGKRVQAPAFDITDAGHRQARINELTAKINDEEDPDFRAMWRKERAELATWKEPGSKRRPREPFRYENESARATQERHAVAQAAAGPAFEHDQKRAKETADQVRALLKQARGSTGLKDEQVLEIVQGAKLNPRQMRLLADEFAVEFRPNNAFEKPLRTKAAREAYFASSVAGAHRRNPLGRTSVR